MESGVSRTPPGFQPTQVNGSSVVSTTCSSNPSAYIRAHSCVRRSQLTALGGVSLLSVSTCWDIGHAHVSAHQTFPSRRLSLNCGKITRERKLEVFLSALWIYLEIPASGARGTREETSHPLKSGNTTCASSPSTELLSIFGVKLVR